MLIGQDLETSIYGSTLKIKELGPSQKKILLIALTKTIFYYNYLIYPSCCVNMIVSFSGYNPAGCSYEKSSLF